MMIAERCRSNWNQREEKSKPKFPFLAFGHCDWLPLLWLACRWPCILCYGHLLVQIKEEESITSDLKSRWKPFQNAKVTTAWKKPEAEARLRCSMRLGIMNYNSAGHVMTRDSKSQEPEKWKVPKIPCIDQSHIPGVWMMASTTINNKPTWMSVSSFGEWEVAPRPDEEVRVFNWKMLGVPFELVVPKLRDAEWA